jgi:rhodanese-related sulfurtransferase
VTAEQALAIFKDNIPALRKRVDPSALPTVFVDPRKPRDYQLAHIPGAINLPIEEGMFDKASLWKATKNSSKPVVFYCNGENCPRSHRACETAKTLGYQGKVYYFYTGMGPNGWPRINGPTVSGPNPYPAATKPAAGPGGAAD